MAKHGEAIPSPSPVALELERLDVGSKVALVGHPIHVMLVHFPVAFVVATLGVDVFCSCAASVCTRRAGRMPSPR